MGDFGSATERMRIIDLFALQVFAKNLDRCNFRLLQHYRHETDMPTAMRDVRYRGDSVAKVVLQKASKIPRAAGSVRVEI
jgi:hypothetical protein